MGESAKASTQVLRDLKVGLTRFGSDARESINAFEAEIRRTLDWLSQRSSHWNNEVRRRKEQVAEARAELRDCESSGDEENEPDCSEYEGNLRRTQESLREAEVELRRVAEFLRLVQEGVGKYQRQARLFGGLLSGGLAKADAILEQKIAHLESYSAVRLPYGSADMVAPTTAQTDTATESPRGQGTWCNIGIIEVPLSEIDLSDSNVHGPADFTKMPESEARAVLQRFQEVVRPAVAAGKAAEYFSELDQVLDLDFEHGFRRAYDWFYGLDAVKLDRTEHGYAVTNGYHRLYLARLLGWTSIPASVFVKRSTPCS